MIYTYICDEERKVKVEDFTKVLGAQFYTGVPDSQLKALCNYLMATYGVDGTHHIIAANEGNCTGIAAGYHLATGKVPVVYMQNSGEGNIINPVASLMNDKVYAIPCIFVVGWRGEPGVHDEPQHIYQGEVTVKLLEDMDIATYVIGKDTTVEELSIQMKLFEDILSAGKQVAFVVKKGALEYDGKIKYINDKTMVREEIIEHIVATTGEDIIVSTTGKASRELFEIRERRGEGHDKDFLTVGSMGHSSSIALGIALQQPDRKLWIVDGDGAALMHMGSMAVMAANAPHKVVHIVINNGAHETVGGQPTVASQIDLITIAKGCGYKNIFKATSFSELDEILAKAKALDELAFIEIECAMGARDDLGRPTTTARENKEHFMKYIQQ